MLPIALVYRSGLHVFAGELAAASALIQEAETIAVATGTTPLMYARLLLGAWRGVEAEAWSHQRRPRAHAGEGTVVAMAGYATAVLNNGLGRYEAAADGAQAQQRRGRLRLRRGVAAGARRGGIPFRQAGGRRRRAAPARGAHARRGHGLGARRPGPFAGAAQRGRRRRRALPRGDRAARAHPDPHRARPRPSALRRMAPARGPARRRARAASSRPRHVQPRRGRGVRRARPPRALGHRRDRAQAHAGDA